MGDTRHVSHSHPAASLHPGRKRVEFNLGYACNNRCVFCSEALMRRSEPGRALARELDTATVLGNLLAFHRRGFRHVTFLGGEPTLRADFLKLVSGAKRIGYDRIFLTTNGRRLADRAYAAALMQAGLGRVYLSVHGPDATTHDGATGSPGAFGQVCAALENLRGLGVSFGMASVIYSRNLTRLEDLLAFQLDAGASRLFWSVVRPVGGAGENFHALVPSYRDVSEAVAVALHAYPDAPLTLAHMPLCLMPGLERHVDELYWAASAIEREVEKFVDQNDGTQRQAVTVTRGHYKTRHDRCVSCRFVAVCAGVPSEYVRQRGFSEFLPVSGEPVHDPATLCDPHLLMEDH